MTDTITEAEAPVKPRRPHRRTRPLEPERPDEHEPTVAPARVLSQPPVNLVAIATSRRDTESRRLTVELAADDRDASATVLRLRMQGAPHTEVARVAEQREQARAEKAARMDLIAGMSAGELVITYVPEVNWRG